MFNKKKIWPAALIFIYFVMFIKKCVKFLRPLRGAFKCNNILKLKKKFHQKFSGTGVTKLGDTVNEKWGQG